MDALTAMKQALEALDYGFVDEPHQHKERDAILSLRSAIEAQEKQHNFSNKLKAENDALHERLYRISVGQPQFANVYCSQCGGAFGPANHGFSSCKEHTDVKVVDGDMAITEDRPTDAEFEKMMRDEMRRAEFDAEMRLDAFGPVHE